MRAATIGKTTMSAFILASAAAGAGQLAPTYSGFSDAPTSASAQEYWDFMAGLGNCLVRTKRVKAMAFMQTEANSAGEKTAFDALINRNGANVCMRNMVRASISRGELRGVIAEGLLRSQPDHVTAPGQPAPIRDVRSIEDFADCNVAGHSGDARSLLSETRLGTKDERVRVGRMAGSFGDCLPAGRQVRLVATDVRLALAGALYRARYRARAAGEITTRRAN